MGNSTTTLQSVLDYCSTFGDISPVVGAPGFANQKALTIANDVMTEMVSARFNWKWNRFIYSLFQTISWQQDYASLSVLNLAWLEHGVLVDINNTSYPKPIWKIEVDRDLELTSYQFGQPGQAAWLPNDQLIYAVWGRGRQGDPGANTVYTQPLGATSTPSNPFIQIQDPNGNLWVLTTYGTTGGTQPSWPSTPNYPTYANPSQVATTQADGSCVWTAVNPKAAGIRLNPIPPQSGVVWQVYLVGQMKPPQFTTLAQTLEPIPDDFAKYFRQGFVTQCYRHSVDSKVRLKFTDEYKLWLASMQEAKGSGDRERDAVGFYPSQGIMDSSCVIPLGPAWPYGPSYY